MIESRDLRNSQRLQIIENKEGEIYFGEAHLYYALDGDCNDVYLLICYSQGMQRRDRDTYLRKTVEENELDEGLESIACSLVQVTGQNGTMKTKLVPSITNDNPELIKMFLSLEGHNFS